MDTEFRALKDTEGTDGATPNASGYSVRVSLFLGLVIAFPQGCDGEGSKLGHIFARGFVPLKAPPPFYGTIAQV